MGRRSSLVAALVTYALPQATAGIAMLLLFNVAAAALLLPFRWGMLVTARLTKFTQTSLATILEL